MDATTSAGGTAIGEAGARREGKGEPQARRAFIKLAGAAAAGGVAAMFAGAKPAAAAVTVDGGSAAMPNDAIQVRRGTATDWAPFIGVRTLLPGEIGVETDTGRVKVGNASTTPWGQLAYVDGYAADVIEGHINAEVMLDGLPVASQLRGGERLLGWQPGAPAADVMIDAAMLSAFHRADTYQSLAVTADLEPGATLVLAYAGAGGQLRLPEFVVPTYPERPGLVAAPWRVRIIQTGGHKLEIARVLVNGQPNMLVSICSYALTSAAGKTRLRTKGQWAVVEAEAVLNLGPTIWVISGDVEAF